MKISWRSSQNWNGGIKCYAKEKTQFSGSHAEHRVLKLYRHVYKDVVLLDQMRKHIDCTNIQAYRSNKQLVICLHPLPHSGKCTREEAACETCTRVLLNPNANRYCSIECKVKAFLKKPNDMEPPFLAIHSPSPPEPKAKRARKGVPHRAPFQ
ncbi:hypothetical protein Vadar_034422 [Vaccinium darrowii]|uniref:Uncharacterized protein n=1 Tax=Vaccinium darrowii TaxID=229202 RepID=A0ACB7YK20_9ERIC|nr:hypothetical protein Vadar_034422 [Vaccinium darrowii]